MQQDALAEALNPGCAITEPRCAYSACILSVVKRAATTGAPAKLMFPQCFSMCNVTQDPCLGRVALVLSGNSLGMSSDLHLTLMHDKHMRDLRQ